MQTFAFKYNPNLVLSVVDVALVLFVAYIFKEGVEAEIG